MHCPSTIRSSAPCLGRARGSAGQLVCKAHSSSAYLPPVMVNSCSGKMGHEAATALVTHGFSLVPHSFTGLSAGVAVKNIGVRGVPVQLVGSGQRQAALNDIKEKHPDLMVLDYTLAHCVEDHVRFYAENGLPFVMGTSGGDRRRIHEIVEASGVHAILPSPAGEQAASLHALLVSLGAPVPAHFEQLAYEAVGRARDEGAFDLLNPGAATEITRALRALGIQCEEAQVHRMRAARQQRVADLDLDHEPAASLHALQGRGTARSCRLTLSHHHPTAPPGDGGGDEGGDGGEPVQLLLRHYGLDRTAFAVGAVEAVRFLAERVAEGAGRRVYDMVDVVRWVQARQAATAAAQRGGGGGARRVVNNAVPAGAAVVTAVRA